MDAAERGRIMLRLADLLDVHGQATARLETTDNGRPIRETRAQAGIVAKWYRYFGGMADKVEGATIPVEGRYLNYTQRVPVGVCGAIPPWNYPTLIASKKIAPALAFGNTVVVKPSELAPLGVLELGRLAQEAGLPPGVLNIITGGREAGENPGAVPVLRHCHQHPSNRHHDQASSGKGSGADGAAGHEERDDRNVADDDRWEEPGQVHSGEVGGKEDPVHLRRPLPPHPRTVDDEQERERAEQGCDRIR